MQPVPTATTWSAVVGTTEPVFLTVLLIAMIFVSAMFHAPVLLLLDASRWTGRIHYDGLAVIPGAAALTLIALSTTLVTIAAPTGTELIERIMLGTGVASILLIIGAVIIAAVWPVRLTAYAVSVRIANSLKPIDQPTGQD